MTKTSLFGTLLIVFVYLASPARADQVKYLARPEQSFAAFTRAIESAKKTIDLATFIFEPCEPSARIVLEKLVGRARAGVKIRVLLDAFQQKEAQKQNLADAFAREGIAVKFFSNSIFDINTRFHGKYMVIDEAAYIAGGRNISDSYFGLSSVYNYVDRDVFVYGPSAREVRASFDEVWDSPMSDTIEGDASLFEPWTEFCEDRNTNYPARIAQAKAYLKLKGAAALANAKTYSCPQVEFHADGPDFAREIYGQSWEGGRGAARFMTSARLGRKRATREVVSFMLGSQRSLRAENWVYMPIGGLERAFSRLRSKKIDVQVLTNYDMEEEGPSFFREAKEVAILNAANRDARGTQKIRMVSSLGSLGTKFELTPSRTRSFLHGKTMVRDAKDVLVGSFNFDSRSAHINLESVVSVSDCPDLAADVNAQSDQVQRAYEFDRNSGRIPEREAPTFLAILMAELFISEF